METEITKSQFIKTRNWQLNKPVLVEAISRENKINYVAKQILNSMNQWVWFISKSKSIVPPSHSLESYSLLFRQVQFLSPSLSMSYPIFISDDDATPPPPFPSNKRPRKNPPTPTIDTEASSSPLLVDDDDDVTVVKCPLGSAAGSSSRRREEILAGEC